MPTKTKTTSTSLTPSYDDFEPHCEFKKEDGLETMIINLPGFKKEQLRVQVNKDGVLKVSGEKPSADGSKRSRFVKETKIPEGCDINEIRAKFITGRLHVIMPKKVAPAPPPPVVQQQPAEPPRQEVADQKPKAETPAVVQKKPAEGSKSHGNGSSDHMFEQKGILQKLQGKKKMILGFGIAAVTMVAIGAFVASKYGSSSLNSPSLYMED